MNWIIIISILFSSSSQLLLKIGVMQLNNAKTPYNLEGVIGIVSAIFTNIYILTGIAFQVFALLIWLYVLKRVEVSYAYPFIALGFIFVMFFSYLFFDESLDTYKVIGGAIICLGIFVLSFSKQGV